MASIFVQIASYRDQELSVTIQNAIDTSSGDNKLVFGIHNCILSTGEVSIDLYEIPPWIEIKYIESIAPKNIGVQLSRKIANSLYENEDYYFQIDAHSQFQMNWDRLAISDYLWYKNMGISKPLISMYPPNYSYKDGIAVKDIVDDAYSTKISFKEKPEAFSLTYIPSQLAYYIEKECYYTPSVSAGMIFTEGSFALITPNEKIAFWGEEILIAARAFTHGFNLVTARNHLIWHLYHSGQTAEQSKRYHVWQDFPEIWAKIDSYSKKELSNIFDTERIGEDALGSERSLSDFGQFAGLDFKNRLVL